MNARNTINRASQSLTLATLILGAAALVQPIQPWGLDSELTQVIAPQSAIAVQPSPPDNGGPQRTQGAGTR
ncbi:MAG: hypothetical protein EA001_16090 [Oscillatoriales cyanobacterium]|nr:MAG: hypothetical protein EA001_16090 [Oscillatoriales cyanobacterium]